jgi:hypothetical protein
MFSTHFAQPPQVIKRPFNGDRLEMWVKTLEILDIELGKLPVEIHLLYAKHRGILLDMIINERNNDPLKPKEKDAPPKQI